MNKLNLLVGIVLIVFIACNQGNTKTESTDRVVFSNPLSSGKESPTTSAIIHFENVVTGYQKGACS